MKPRKAQRFRLRFRIFFSGGTVEGEGTVTDISKTGCKVECDTEVQPGIDLELHVFLPDHNWPMKVEQATVRWVRGRTFGLEFTNLRPTERERLRRFAANLELGHGH